ncbi:carbohydrate-binding module family 13 protein [Wolfiporia cocos MD-104 SS10]|uniref:Carbohydrate-binding module family 13 protein n=1 Tax=Wolfiporia cocos (strain MD-104) TaxID=742152 RepID=A0A2H3JXT3_WOLCO|nr:carbohydrate-binding module family 13 protein [Wolfiporia cocos MD-104 SS10]
MYHPAVYPLAGRVFCLTNLRSGTALDLAYTGKPGDFRMEGHILHMEANQQWRFIESGKGYVIQSLSTAPNGPWYVTARTSTEGSEVIATPFPATWDIQLDKSTGAYRIFWPTTDLVLDLHDGRAEPGTRIHLITKKRDLMCQLWKLIPQESPHAQNMPPAGPIEHTSQSDSQPMVSETVLVSEDRDFVTTYRTRTTTTTVTTITKRARIWSDLSSSETDGGSTAE